MSKSEIILTGLALIVGSFIMIRYSIPMLLEWLDAVSIDETTTRKDDKHE